ncbi:MAG: hypothetical protein OXG29_03970 [Gammaproteobacteria bacterium]|nr:hypothetical protein [Alphaproteobacteria bacterium]MCY3940224.1 hypothetical protein [Gammaproteobacteria bacterium]
MNTERIADLSRIGKRLALAAVMLAVALFSFGPAHAQGGPTVDQCLAAFNESSASGSCPLSNNQFWVWVTSDGQCSAKMRCPRSNGWPSAMQTVTGDLDDMRDLDNCDGRLEVGCNDAAEADAEAGALSILTGQCRNAWNGSGASQDCGSSYGTHSVSASGQQCHVSTTCGTLASTASFFGSPDEVRELRYCNQLSTSCPRPVTAQNCGDAWYASSASNSCYSSDLGNLSVTVSNDQCRVSTPCLEGSWGSGMKQASFSGTVEQTKTLKNCSGTLKAGSC